MQFLSLTLNRRAEIVKEHGCCFACLDDVHEARHCPQKLQCDSPRCNQKRHRLLHDSSQVWPTKVDSHAVANSGGSHTATIGTNTVDRVSICLSVIPVTVLANNRSMQSYALLDPGSQGTPVTDEMARSLNLEKKPSNGDSTKYLVTWVISSGGNRVVIPEEGRNAALDELHFGHPGIVRMKGLARSCLLAGHRPTH
ncbi:hypothetical protein TTRE_0000785601 [Trichuris trichiura]|uniref:Uncharacterized protein n=1 Tax=Trichuris trichiura TaxID=36087 RepID=A0A077ZLI3_TRITR|nr:hypothetical protein TTRE_0000785601 [Trichuris trichiura]